LYNISVLSALKVFYDKALYKSTFYLFTYLLCLNRNVHDFTFEYLSHNNFVIIFDEKNSWVNLC